VTIVYLELINMFPNKPLKLDKKIYYPNILAEAVAK
jgi:hypothetical protein